MQLPLERYEQDERDELRAFTVGTDLYERPTERLVPVLWRLFTVVVAAAIVTATVGLIRFDPLLPAGAGAVQGTTVTTDGTVYTIAFEAGASFNYVFGVQNSSRFGVTVTGIEAPRHGAFEEVQILAAPPGAIDFEPMRSFALAAGETARFMVQALFGECMMPPPSGARSVWSSDRVNFRVLGINNDTPVELPYTVSIDTMFAPAC